MSNEEMQKEIEELKAWKASLERSSAIPLNVDQAFRKRLSVVSPTTSTKGATSENQAVDEGGMATYDVLKPPDGFLQIEINGTIYYLPYFT